MFCILQFVPCWLAWVQHSAIRVCELGFYMSNAGFEAASKCKKYMCAWTNGTAAKASECAYERPATIQTCNSQVKCPTCVSPHGPQHSVLLVNA